MKLFRSIAICLSLLALPIPLQSCGGVCKNTAALYVTGIGLISEAESALGQVEAMLAVTTLPQAQKEQIAQMVRRGHEALQKASLVMRQTKEACDASKDLPGLFADFNAVWTVIRPLVPAIIGAVGTGPGSATIEDPTCYRLR